VGRISFGAQKEGEGYRRTEKSAAQPNAAQKEGKKADSTHCPWKPGDLLLYKLNTIEDRYPQYQNKYVLIRIAALMKLPLFDIERDTLFDLVPVCAVYDWMSDNACVPDHYEDLTYLPIYAKTYNCKSVSFLMSELKKKEIQIVGHEADFESKTQGILDVKRGKAVLGTFDSLEISIAYNYERIHG